MTAELPSPPPARAPSPRTGRLVAGILLIVFGVGWLLELLGVDGFPWDVLVPGALILVGGALLVVAERGGSQAGLITIGVVLLVLLVLGSAVDVPFGGGVGARTERPASMAAIGDEYRLGVGELTLDLTHIADLQPQEPLRAIHARVGVGHLLVIVPEGTPVHATASAGLGQVQIFNTEGSGFDVQRTVAPPTGETAVLDLALSVGLGQVEVRYG
jgi:cell wall-active antibiotic response 4TMS protein YvqF